ncbi:hypothetical protein V1477_017667, partial [Vespula maculifrons]
TSSVSLCTSTSVHRSVYHTCFPNYIIISLILPIFYANYYMLELNCEMGIIGFAKRQQKWAFDRL